MKLTESQLREIILEEIERIELEELLDEEAAKLGIVLTEELRESVMDWFDKHKQKLGATVVGLSLAGFLGFVRGEVAELDAAQRETYQQMLDDFQAAKETPEGRLKAMEEFLYTPTGGNKWIWGEKGSQELFSSYTDKDGLTMVMPPEFSVLQQVHDDYEQGANKGEVPVPAYTAETAVPSADAGSTSAEYAQRARSAKDVKHLSHTAGIHDAVYLPAERYLSADTHMQNADMSESELYVKYWEMFVGY